MNKKIIYSLVVLAVVFFVTSLIIFLKSGGEPQTGKPQIIKNEIPKPGEKPAWIRVKAFFFVERSRFMRPVVHEIKPSNSKEDYYREFLQFLIKGQENYISPVPEGVSLRSLYLIESKKMLVVDFSEELVHKFPAGTTSELEFIYFIVNNICFNFKEIKKVKFLVSGNEYRTLSGHLDFENPFFPDYRYLRDE
ncbi:MAG: GerMN domain-containing protein [bacterium]|nr:GerMN domain-containing protein [bacterium]